MVAIGATAIVACVLLSFIAFGMYTSTTAPDTQCTTAHAIPSRPLAAPKTAADYFFQGNYDYDTGDCKRAILDYTQAITRNPDYVEAFNNRAYTYMRMKDYKDALPDLDRAIQINSRYIQALMNRGDIHNYYYHIDRQAAIADYERVISLTNNRDTSVCGHLFLAKHNGWNAGTVVGLFSGEFLSCR